MSWKKFKADFKNKYPDETNFILGIDLGNKTSSISYFDVFRKQAEVIDISGGYGKASLPTVIQYISENKEWVFGEYALLNSNEKNLKVNSMLKDLGKKKYYNIGEKSVSIVTILSMYIKELISNCKNLNPRADIVGIVISVPNYIDKNELDELKASINKAGYEKYVIEFAESRKCILSKYFYEKEIKTERILMLDFGSEELRLGIYDVEKNININVDCIASTKDEMLGEKNVERLVNDLFLNKIKEERDLDIDELSEFEKEQLNTFSYQNKDLLFQKNITKKPIKLYYNFVHPPIQHTIKIDDINSLMGEFQNEFKSFILNSFNKIVGEKKVSIENIDKVICTGGGFESLWAKTICTDIFGSEKIISYKNSKSVAAEGASIIAASQMGIINDISFEIRDNNLLKFDIGIKVLKDKQERFFAIAERNSFWWKEVAPVYFFLNKEDNSNYDLKIFSRDKRGDISVLQKISLENFPKRPKGTLKFKLKLNFNKYNEINVCVEDNGFGEIFPKTDFERNALILI